MTATIPGICDHCDRPATSYFGHWDGGAPREGTHHQSAKCDYHLGNPPGSIPGRCWTCGQPISTDDAHTTWTFQNRAVNSDHVEVFFIANMHDHCTNLPDLPRDWAGPKQCARCGEQIGYGQRHTKTTQEWDGGRTYYTHARCPQ